MTEPPAVNKIKSQPRPLADFLKPALGEAFAKQGFTSAELVTRWADIIGADIAKHCEPLKIQWPRNADPSATEPATLVLRVEGPTALEIQHLSSVILQRVNQFFGWQAVGRLALRQAPLARRERPPPAVLDPAATAREAAELTGIADDGLRDALARLGAAVKQG
jgi:hypothetical protein